MNKIKGFIRCFSSNTKLSHLQIHSLQQSIPDLSSIIKEIPKSTGSGLFVEHPSFKHFGSINNLLNVSLPSHSYINLRSTNSITLANGQLNNVSIRAKILQIHSKPLIYNELTSSSPLQLLISNKNGGSFITVSLNKNETWTVWNSSDLLGWYGSQLSIQTNQQHKVEVLNGDDVGSLILSSQGESFEISLEKDEILNVNSQSIIAIEKNNVSLVTPYSWSDTLLNYTPSNWKSSNYYKYIQEKLSFIYKYLPKEEFIQIKGPNRIIIGK